ncbi:MAG: TetR/AcrR family transcriptional regulator [Pseudobdellovibrionaceae bacterium]|nr:TetR/AcrR family transcriptional regulator [Pseudobdellovibrionaceae bacterium]
MEDRKLQILEAARELIEAKGFSDFSYADLEARVHIRKPSIHHHFPRKDDLGLAILDGARHYLDRKRREIQAFDGDGWGKLELMFKDGCANVCATGRVCTINALQTDFGSLSEAMQKALKQVTELESEIYAEVLEQGRRNGEFAFKGSSYDHAVVVLAAIKGSMQMARVLGQMAIETTQSILKRYLTSS